MLGYNGRTMWKRFDSIPLLILVIGTLTLGLAPFRPEPHLWEKLKMLVDGTLVRPLDIFDLFLHGAFPVALLLRMLRDVLGLSSPPES